MAIISVIIPVYNGELTIFKTIESVLSQTLSDFELIVINADSSDFTLDIVSSIKDQRLKVFTYPKANVAVNRNRGVTHVNSEFVTFLDADDLWTPDKLETQYQALKECPQAAVVYSWTNAIDEKGKFLRGCSTIAVTGDVYPHLLLEDFIGNGSNVMIRKQAFIAVGGFDELLTNAQDSDLWLRLAARHHFVALPKVQILYRVSANSMSSDVGKLENACLEVLERAFNLAPESLQYLKPYCLGNLYKYLLYRVLEGQPESKKTRIAAIFLLKAIATDKSLLFKRVILKALLKLGAIVFLSNKQSYALFDRFPLIFNTSTLLGYIKLDPFSLKNH
jgi:glycosyltransferase involved in cell wall biosynthesis